jgi:hypothetical protein
MPGILNAHRFAIRKHAKFIRLRHTETSQGSLFLSDLDTSENKRSNNKVPSYIPYGETVDILFIDRVVTSYQQGSIRGFLDAGLLEAHIVQNVEVDEGIEAFLPAYDVAIDDTFLTVDTTQGTVLVNLPDIFSEPFPENRTPEGTRVTIKKTSSDTNSVLISAPTGNLIDGDSTSYLLTNPKATLILESDSRGNWWVILDTSQIGSGGGGGGGSTTEALSTVAFTHNIRVPASRGILYLKNGTTVTTVTPWIAPDSLKIVGCVLSVDREDPQGYTIDLFINDTLQFSVPLNALEVKTYSPLNINMLRQDELAVRIRRSDGQNKSIFRNIHVNLQLEKLL